VSVFGATRDSFDTTWLKQCGDHNARSGNSDIAAAAYQRIRDVELAKALHIKQGANTLEDRVMESLRVYRAVLKHKHGRNQSAGYTERDIKKFGPKEALIKTIRTGRKTDGLKNLRDQGRLDCSYEQIAIEFAEDLPEDVVAQARKTLAEQDSS